MTPSKSNEEEPGEAYGWSCSAVLCFAGKQPYAREPHYKDLMLKNQMIEQELEREKMANKKVMKILLLGKFEIFNTNNCKFPGLKIAISVIRFEIQKFCDNLPPAKHGKFWQKEFWIFWV